MTAPSAIAAARPSPGSRAWRSSPVAKAETTTSATDRLAIGVKFRRKSVTGVLMAAA
jgi:hypothetical protein